MQATLSSFSQLFPSTVFTPRLADVRSRKSSTKPLGPRDGPASAKQQQHPGTFKTSPQVPGGQKFAATLDELAGGLSFLEKLVS